LIVGKKLASLFRQVVYAENGTDGLEKFRQHNVDLIITDNLMPGMGGLDVIREIRKTDIKTPVILVTAFINTDILMDSINLGVTQFIAKPVTENNLIKAIEMAVQRVVFGNLLQKSRDQELQLLRYHEKYHSGQQELAFRKELNIIKNDLCLRKVDLTCDNGERQEWFVDPYFKPLDIMSGDSYSVREVGEGKILLFLVDAMGKGLSASVTSILSTSFANYLVDRANEHNSFEFTQFLEDYTGFIRKEILEDEIVCATFAFLDLKARQMDAAIFSMPSIMGHTVDDRIIKIKSNNLPIMKFHAPNRIERHDISMLKKILLYTDGLNECFKNMDSLYQEDLEKDFKLSGFKAGMLDSFSAKITKPEDDVTFFFIKRLDCKPKWTKIYAIDSRMEEIRLLRSKIESILSSLETTEEFTALFINSFNEMLLNAYEHGNMNIDHNLKNELIKIDTYEEYILTKEKKTDKKITVTLSLHEENGKEFLVLTIADEGPGFDMSVLQWPDQADAYKFTGRGIKITRRFVDTIFYNRKGNEVTVIKQITGGSHGSEDDRCFGNINTGPY
jgi:CheY-like chemotaxis protein